MRRKKQPNKPPENSRGSFRIDDKRYIALTVGGDPVPQPTVLALP